LNLSLLAAHRRYVGQMKAKAIEQTQRIALATRHRDEARTELAEAAKARKTIEKLREKAFSAWRDEQMKKELAQLDEIGMQLAISQLPGSADDSA
jgi:flagellar export protein FliJ